MTSADGSGDCPNEPLEAGLLKLTSCTAFPSAEMYKCTCVNLRTIFEILNVFLLYKSGVFQRLPDAILLV